MHWMSEWRGLSNTPKKLPCILRNRTSPTPHLKIATYRPVLTTWPLTLVRLCKCKGATPSVAQTIYMTAQVANATEPRRTPSQSTDTLKTHRVAFELSASRSAIGASRGRTVPPSSQVCRPLAAKRGKRLRGRHGTLGRQHDFVRETQELPGDQTDVVSLPFSSSLVSNT